MVVAYPEGDRAFIETEGIKVYHANPNLLSRAARSYYQVERSVPYLTAVQLGEDVCVTTPRQD